MSVDEMVGRILANVKSLGVQDSTYFFYTSDNGWHLGEHLLPPFNKVRAPVFFSFCSDSL